MPTAAAPPAVYQLKVPPAAISRPGGRPADQCRARSENISGTLLSSGAVSRQ